MKKILIILVVTALLLLSLAACKKDGPVKNAPQLDTPSNIRFEGTTLLWDAVNEADLYIITVFTNTSSYTLSQAETSYIVPISTAGNYIVTLKAKRSDATYKDSSISQPIIYHLGAGTELDPILIYSKEELAKIGIGATVTTVNSQTTTTAHYYKLFRDIDLGGMEWTPIGTTVNRFQGHFDGQGYTISNYKITIAHTAEHGLFKGVLNGSIKNLNISDYNININNNGLSRIGGLAGYVTNSIIENCHANGTLNFKTTSTSIQNIGQLIGFMDTATTVLNCSANGALTAEGAAGGGTLNVGGLVGQMLSASSVLNCSANGALAVEGGGTLYVGGLVGENRTGTIRYSYSLGTVNAKGRSLNVGGLAGYNREAGSLVSNCYSRVNLVTEASSSNNTGALIGHLYNNATVEYSYSTGSITWTTSPTLRLGFIGYATTTLTLTELYYDYELMGLGINKDINNTDHSKIYSRTTEQMKTQSIYNNWDFETIWIIDAEVNDGYPTLRPYVAPVVAEEV